MDDWKQQMREIREANARMLAKLKQMDVSSERLQSKLDQIRPNESLPNKPEQNQFHELFLRMIDQQNQFHERLLTKLDEIVKALRK